MDGVAIAFAERESDRARMTILRLPDGELVARRRLPEDSIVPTHQVGRHNDPWRHVRSGGTYVRHDDVRDLELGVIHHDYSSFADGRLWLRPIAEWTEVVDGRPRFERA